MFTLATVYGHERFDEIYCFTDHQSEWREWVAEFRRLGVAIADSDLQD